MKRADDGPLDPELRDALRVLADEQRALAAPTAVENRVMRAWDDAHRSRPRSGGRFGRRSGLLAIAATVVLAVSIWQWWTSGAGEPVASPGQPAVAAPWPSDDALAWVDADPASLHVVRIRVASTALAEHGYVVSDPDGDGLVDVEMVVGADGIAQTVRLSPTTAPMQYQ